MKNNNIVLICLDSVRKDVFDKFASRLRSRSDYSYNQCRAASSWSVPSHASMITGLLPHQHGVHTYNRSYDDVSFEDTFMSNLPDQYETIGISANVFAGPTYGFDEFFDEFVDAPRYQLYANGLNAAAFFHNTDAQGIQLYYEYLKSCVKSDNPIKSLINGATIQIQNTTSKLGIPNPMDDGARLIAREARNKLEGDESPTFMFINFMDAHTPYEYIWGIDRSHLSGPLTWTSRGENVWEIQENPEKYREYLYYRREFYEASVDYLDRIISNMIEDIQSITGRPTTIIITSDHGENMGADSEENLIDHKSSLSESLLHVPLEVLNPPKEVSNPTNDNLISHLSIPELVTTIAKGKSIDSIESCCIASELIGMGAGEKPASNFDYWNRAIRTVYDGQEKFLYDSIGNEETYRLDLKNPCYEERIKSSIPGEIDSKFDEGLRDVKELAAGTQKSKEIDEATRNRLEELGYV